MEYNDTTTFLRGNSTFINIIDIIVNIANITNTINTINTTNTHSIYDDQDQIVKIFFLILFGGIGLIVASCGCLSTM